MTYNMLHDFLVYPAINIPVTSCLDDTSDFTQYFDIQIIFLPE